MAHAKAQEYHCCFLICQVICSDVIEESAQVIGKSQSMRKEGPRTDEERERWKWRWGMERREGGVDKLEAKERQTNQTETPAAERIKEGMNRK